MGKPRRRPAAEPSVSSEDEFEDEESWEDILTAFDSNDNGVFDEEDYAAAQERGDEDLAESWDEVLEGDINDDGVIDEEEYNAWDDAEEDWEEFDPFADLSMDIFDDEEEIEMVMVMTGSFLFCFRYHQVRLACF